MILYPTDTIYGLGVNALDRNELKQLFELKGRDASKSVSWLVRTVADIERYAVLSEKAKVIAEHFLPGPITFVVPSRVKYGDDYLRFEDDCIGFRIVPDPVTQNLVEEYMAAHDAPLTATSANRSGQMVLETPQEILEQLGEYASAIDRVIDDGPRSGIPSTVVKIVGDTVTFGREGAISAHDILKILE